jgi:hypothetical protein
MLAEAIKCFTDPVPFVFDYRPTIAMALPERAPLPTRQRHPPPSNLPAIRLLEHSAQKPGAELHEKRPWRVDGGVDRSVDAMRGLRMTDPWNTQLGGPPGSQPGQSRSYGLIQPVVSRVPGTSSSPARCDGRSRRAVR